MAGMYRLNFSPRAIERIGYEISAAMDGLTVYHSPAAQVLQQAFENIFADRETAEAVLAYLLAPGGPLMPEPQQPPIVYTVEASAVGSYERHQVFIRGVPVGWVEAVGTIDPNWMPILGDYDHPDARFPIQVTMQQARDLVAHAWLERHGLRFNRS
jgi:hypothetical protein